MVSPKLFYDTLTENGVSFFAGVPDSLLKNVCAYITDHADKQNNIIAANEGSAIGLAVGHYLATNEIPMVYMQNSGIGNAVNPLLSLADELVYSIPVLLVIGWRGEPGVPDEPQHLKQGLVTLELLDAMKMPYVILSDKDDEAARQTERIISDCRETSKPHAIVIRKDTFGKYALKNKSINNNPLSREAAMKIAANQIPAGGIIVSTTGKLSRELYEYRDATNRTHESDFLTVGSMGHSSSIALGIALSKPERPVYCFDGDGAFIMHMGALGNIGNQAPKNFVHVLFNNGVHESVGAQPTLGFEIQATAIAKACGYTQTTSVITEEEIIAAFTATAAQKGPTFIEIKVGIDSRDNLGRPKTSPQENKESFMKFLNDALEKK